MLDNFFYSDDFEHIGLMLDNFSIFSSYYHLSTGFLHLSNFFNIFLFGINPLFYQITNLVFHLFNVILVGLVIPIAAIMFAYAGFELLTSGGVFSSKRMNMTPSLLASV